MLQNYEGAFFIKVSYSGLARFHADFGFRRSFGICGGGGKGVYCIPFFDTLHDKEFSLHPVKDVLVALPFYSQVSYLKDVLCLCIHLYCIFRVSA